MDYYASYKNSKVKTVKPLVVEKRIGQLRANVWQQKSCTALSNSCKNGQKMEKALARKKGVGLKDLSKKPEKSPRMMKMYWQFKIKALAEKATADNKRINAAVELNASIASLTPSRRLSNI